MIVMNEQISLDVGCGDKPFGDVNVDLYPNVTIHRSNRKPLKTSNIKNFIKCDVHYLPFKNSIFNVVHSRNVLEHISNPLKMIREMIRVSNHKVIFFTVHRFDRRTSRKHIAHKHTDFNCKSISKSIHNLGFYCSVETVKFRCIPHVLFPLFRLPSIIKVTVFKGKNPSGVHY